MEESEEQKYSNTILLLRFAISNSFKHIAESVSEEAFLDILTVLKSKPNIVRKLHERMCKHLFDNMNDDLEEILKDESLQEGLKRVMKLTDAESSVNEDAWRPPGNVSLHLRSLDAKIIKEESELLEKRVNEIEEENAILMNKITDERSKIINMNDNITRSLSIASTVIGSLEERLEGLEKCLMLLDHKDD